MDLNQYYDEMFIAHAAVVTATRDRLKEPFAAMLQVWARAIRAKRKLVFFGNGGSASDAQHLATELVVRFKKDRSPIAALALTTDTSTLTAAANDLGFDQIFARQIEALCQPGDVAVGISTSGESANVIAGLKRAREMDLVATALTGGNGGDLPRLADPILIVPSTNTARIQEMHIMLGQMLCGALELELCLV